MADVLPDSSKPQDTTTVGGELSLREDGRDVRMEVPRVGGGTDVISSKTLTPAFMKDLRNDITQIVLSKEENRQDPPSKSKSSNRKSKGRR